MDAGDLIKKYIELRDRKKVMADKQSEEMKPLNDAMGVIENALMHVMNTTGVSQLKQAGVGTAFRTVANSTQLADPVAFKGFIFQPAVDGILHYLSNIGLDDNGVRTMIPRIIAEMPLWDMVDFRAGKKGVVDYVTNEQKPVPGVNINSVAALSVRRDD